MADVSLESAPLGTLDLFFGNGIWGPFWVSDQVGAIIFVNTDGDITARKTTDGGASWGSQIVLEAETAVSLAAWFDQQTPGDTGDLIHIAYHADTAGQVRYANFDISAGAWSTPNNVGALNASATQNSNQIAIHKTRSGRIIVTAVTSAVGSVAAKADSPWSSWTSITSPFESNANDQVLGVVPNTGDNNDGAILFWDISANQISIKVYDDSGNSWTETIIASSQAESTTWKQMASTMRLSDGHILLATWSQFDNAAADLRFFDIYADTVASVFFVEKANVLTNTDNAAMVDVFVNQNSDTIYVAYGIGTNPTADLIINYKKSTDDGDSWGEQTLMQEDASDDHRLLNSGAMGNQSSGRYMPAWFDDDDLEIYVSSAYDVLQNKPTVALNTPADTGTVNTVTPTLDFTGSDPANTSLNYEIQIDTVNTFDSQGGATIEDTFTSDGWWKCPEGITSVEIHAWGGGGGGHGEDGTQGGGGGGGGAYSKKNSMSVTPGQRYKVKVGAGGPGGASGVDGTAGGDSWFNSTSDVLAKGGLGGVGGNATSAGGQASSGVGDTKTNGGTSGAGGGSNGGGGGGSGGTGGNGGNGSNGNGGGASGGTAGSGTGGYPGFAGANGSSASGNGVNATATNYGAGGGGAGDGGGAIGGNGASGRVIIKYTGSKYPLIDKVSGGASTTETFTADDTWTAPVGVNTVTVEAWGAGGGGGGSNGANPLGGAGGGGGAYSSGTVSVTPRTTYTVEVGTGGSGGAATPTNGGTGGDTYFNDASTVMAKGGGGGTANSNTFGTGGASASGVGNGTKNSGGNGGQANLAGGGGGGGSAGSGSVGGTGGNAGVGAGGTAGTAGTGGGAAGGAGGSSALGSAGSSPGGGGGGSGSSAVGGAGQNGQLKITYQQGDAGFDDPDSADTDPFTTGNNITYTLQTNLSEGATYYWRVRARDPNGSNDWGPWSSTRSFTVQSGVTKTFTIDAIVKEINTKTFTADGIIFATNTKTFTIDAVVVASGTLKIDLWSMSFEEPFVLLTFTIDAIVKEINTKTFTVDGIVLAQTTKTFTIDAIVLATTTKTFTADAIVLVETTKTFTIDAIVLVETTKTFTADAIVLAQTTKTFTIDAIIFATNTVTFTADAIIFATNTKTFTADAIVKTIVDNTFTIDGIILVTTPSTFTIDGIVRAETTAVFTIDAIVFATQTFTFTVDGIIKQTVTKTFTIDAIVLTVVTATFTADGIIFATNTKTFTVDARMLLSYYEPFNGGSIPSNWSEKGNGVWSYADNKVAQTTVGNNDPQKVLFQTNVLSQERVVRATLEILALGNGDDRIGISILSRASDGNGVNLLFRYTAGQHRIYFLDDRIAWGTDFDAVSIAVGEKWHFKAKYEAGTFYGKVWKVDTDEPDWMITWVRTKDDTYIYSGITGNSNSLTHRASYDDFHVYSLGRDVTSITIDAIVFATNTSSFTVDGIVKETQTFEFTVDAIVLVTTTKTFTVDGIIYATNTVTFTADGIIFATNEVTFTIDGIVVENLVEFTIDGIVLVITPSTFTIDGIVKAQDTEIFTIDGIVKVLNNLTTFTADGIVLAQTDKTFTIDGIVKTQGNTVTFTVDAIIFATNTSTITIDGLVRAETTKTFTIDGIVLATTLQTFTVDAIVKVITEKTFTVDAIVKWFGPIQLDNAKNGGIVNPGTSLTWSHTTAGTNRILFVAVFGNNPTDIITGVTYAGVPMELVNKRQVPSDRWVYLFALINPALGTNNIIVSASGSTAIAGDSASYTGARQTNNPDVNTTNIASNQSSVSTSLTPLIDKSWTFLVAKGSGGSAPIAGTGTKLRATGNDMSIFDSDGPITPIALNTLIAQRASGIANWATVMATIVPFIPEVTFTIDGIIFAVNTKTFTTDGIVKEINTATFTVDAIVKEINTKTFTADAIIFATNISTFTIDAVVRAETTAVFSIDGIVKVLNNTSTFTADAIILVQNITTFIIDAIVKVVTLTTFTADGIVRVTQTATFTIDGLVEASVRKTFTISGIVRATTTVTFTIDMVIEEGKFAPLGGQGGTERKGLWDEKDTPRGIAEKVPQITDPDDIPVLHNKINELLDGF